MNSCDSLWNLFGVKLNKPDGVPVFFDNIRLVPASSMSIYHFLPVSFAFSVLFYTSQLLRLICALIHGSGDIWICYLGKGQYIRCDLLISLYRDMALLSGFKDLIIVQ